MSDELRNAMTWLHQQSKFHDACEYRYHATEILDRIARLEAELAAVRKCPPVCFHTRESLVGGTGCLLRKGHQSLHHNCGSLYWNDDGEFYVKRGSVLDDTIHPGATDAAK